MPEFRALCAHDLYLPLARLAGNLLENPAKICKIPVGGAILPILTWAIPDTRQLLLPSCSVFSSQNPSATRHEEHVAPRVDAFRNFIGQAALTKVVEDLGRPQKRTRVE